MFFIAGKSRRRKAIPGWQKLPDDDKQRDEANLFVRAQRNQKVQVHDCQRLGPGPQGTPGGTPEGRRGPSGSCL